MATPPPEPEDASLTQEDCYVALTTSHLNLQSVTDRVRSPQAGAIVLFAGLPPLPPPHSLQFH
jgi:molybdopterin synthase catalytic subunit